MNKNDTSINIYQPRKTDLLRMLGLALRYGLSYALDALRNKPCDDPASIPWNFTAATKSWFQNVICTSVPGAVIESVEMGTGHNGTSGRQQFLLEYNEAGRCAGLPASIFAKGTPTLATRISMGAVPSMEIEGTFYRRIRPELDIEAPQAYHSDYDLHTGRSIHLLEDLVASKGASFPRLDTRISHKQARGIVRILAALHGAFYNDPRLTREFSDLISWPEEFRRMSRLMNLPKYHECGFHKARSVIPDALWERRHAIWKAVIRCTELHHQLPQTLIHGDVHLGNWYMTRDGRMGLLDWQCVARGHWSRDLAYALTATLSIDDRREWEADLVTLYLDELQQRCGKRISFDEGWLRYRQQVFSALAFWTPTYSPPAFAPDNMQPEELSLEMIKRFAHAIVDLDSFGSLDAD